MSSAPNNHPPRFVQARWVREILAVVLGGVIGALCFLVVAQEGFKQGYFNLDTNAGVGLLIGAVAEDVPRRGFLAMLAIGVGLAVVQRAISGSLHRPLVVRMLPMAVLVFLLWGLVLCPLLDRNHPEVAAGLFGRDAGGGAAPVIAVASAVFALVLERVSGFVRDIAWWAPKHFDLRGSLEEIFIENGESADAEASLELTEKGPEDRGKRTPG
jgi:hypothetical protein